jgi:hypothetical protein
MWVQLIQKICTCGSAIDVQGIDENEGCEYERILSLAIREAQEAMADGVSIRENGYPVSTA